MVFIKISQEIFLTTISQLLLLRKNPIDIFWYRFFRFFLAFLPKADDRNRTGDLFLTMEMLYQLSYIGSRQDELRFRKKIDYDFLSHATLSFLLQKNSIVYFSKNSFVFLLLWISDIQSRPSDSNRWPAAYKAAALPTELGRHVAVRDVLSIKIRLRIFLASTLQPLLSTENSTI